MADDPWEGQEKTEPASPRKRARAREEGQVPRSPELSGAAVILGGTAMLAFTSGREISGAMVRAMKEAWSGLALPDGGVVGVAGWMQGLGLQLLLPLMGFAGGVAAISVGVNVAQTRGLLTLGPVSPKFSHVDPQQGIRRIFSLESVFNVFKSALKLAILGLVTWQMTRRVLPDLVMLSESGEADIARILARLAFRFTTWIGAAWLVVSALDYAWQYFRMEKNLRMTRQEAIQEHRESEGNPHVKARIQAISRAMARQRMLQKVPTADVIVTNPTHIAVALKYNPAEAAAPLVLAMGQRKLAERIREIARKAGVPLVENKPVARALLATARVGLPIPPALYAAVAEILAFVYRQRRGAGVPRKVQGGNQ